MTQFIVSVSTWNDMRNGNNGIRIIEKDNIEEARKFILKDEFRLDADVIEADVSNWKEKDGVLYINNDKDNSGGGVIIIDELNNYL